MTGSIALSAMAALRTGAGLVTVGCPAESQASVAAHDPCVMTQPVDDAVASTFDALGVGPGLPPDQVDDDFWSELLAAVGDRPLVVDAGAVDLAGRHHGATREHAGPIVMTPHPGEFARLTETSVAAVEADRRGAAETAARALGVVIVLKGAGTIVTDGAQTAMNATGNSGMATAGSGDVLTGVLTALLAEGMPPWDAARLAVHVHGLAGDVAAAKYGRRSMTALDLARSLHVAWQQLDR